MLIVRALRGVLKIRYLLLGGAVAGGGALQKVIIYGIFTIPYVLNSFFLEIPRLERWHA
jgi:hypothetical protein